MRRAAGVALALGIALALACAHPERAYHHSRYDYRELRARVGTLPEPNYLPYVAHRERLPDGSRGYVLCRWPDSAFPLRYHVAVPVIPDEIQNEFHPRDPHDYVVAVHRAFELWHQALRRPVSFESVERPGDADVLVHMEPESHPESVPEGSVQVLGMVRNDSGRCRVTGGTATPDEVEIFYEVPEIHLFLTDRNGLLTPRQVRAIALHEIGHLLGASGQHSPLRGDVMFPIADDRRIEELSEHDVNTFRALYRVPPGTVYVRPAVERKIPMVEARRGPPRLAPPLRHDRFPIEISFPREWQVVRTSRGWVAVDGVTWDYDASIQLMALRGSVGAYLARYGLQHVMERELVGADTFEVEGQLVARMITRSEGRTEETTLMEWEPGWILVAISDVADENYEVYRPWFRFTMLSLEHPSEGSDDTDTDTGGKGDAPSVGSGANK